MLDAHRPSRRTSEFVAHTFHPKVLTSAGGGAADDGGPWCELRVVVANRSSSGGYRFALAGLI